MSGMIRRVLSFLRDRSRDIYDYEFIRHTFFVSLAFTSVVAAKCIHIYFHLGSLALPHSEVWGATLFFKDVILLLLIRSLTGENRRSWMTLVASFLSLDVLLMAAARISFRFAAGTELHWRSVLSFPRDAQGFKTLLSGATTSLIVIAAIVVISYFIQRYIHIATGFVTESLAASFKPLIPSRQRVATAGHKVVSLKDKPPFNKIPPLNEVPPFNRIPSLKDKAPFNKIPTWEKMSVFRFRRKTEQDVKYEVVPEDPESQESYVESEEDSPESRLLGSKAEDAPGQGEQFEVPLEKSPRPAWYQIVVTIVFVVFYFLWIFQPPLPGYMHLEPTLPILPFNFIFLAAQPRHVFRELAHGTDVSLELLRNHGAKHAFPPPPGFLPPESGSTWELDGVLDPLHISNLHDDILEPLQKAFKENNVTIKHVMVIKLESTRNDVFPFQRDSYVWKRVKEAYEDDVPEDVEAKLDEFGTTAQWLTGLESNLSSNITDKQPPRGGINALNAVTTSTYTLKSVTGTMCGIAPMAVDFNKEFRHNIYRPCLPQIFKDLTNSIESEDSGDYRSWPWHSMWMQAVTETYDHQNRLMRKMGYHDVISKETMTKKKAKYPPKTKEVNYYGYAETELREYFRDALREAEENHQRLFLTHLTGSTHHPWGMLGKFDQLLNKQSDQKSKDANRYLNTIGFVDRWLGEMFEMMDEAGISDETLTVLVGDHGITTPYDGADTPYARPDIGVLRVPLVFSHPRLPPLQLDAPVISSQIVPTILDLLVATGSLEKAAAKKARKLQEGYEGQSLLRPQHVTRPGSKPSKQSRRDDSPGSGGVPKPATPENSTVVPPTDESQSDSDESDSDGKKKYPKVRPADRQWHFTVLNPGGSNLGVRDATRPYHLTVPLIEGWEWVFSNLDKDPYDHESLQKRLDVSDLAQWIYDNEGEEGVQWFAEATEITGFWLKENYRRWGWNK